MPSSKYSKKLEGLKRCFTVAPCETNHTFVSCENHGCHQTLGLWDLSECHKPLELGHKGIFCAQILNQQIINQIGEIIKIKHINQQKTLKFSGQDFFNGKAPPKPSQDDGRPSSSNLLTHGIAV